MTLSILGLPFITNNLFFFSSPSPPQPTLLSHTPALKTCPPKLTLWPGTDVAVHDRTMRTCHLNYLWSVGLALRMMHAGGCAKVCAVFEFHTNRKRGVEETLIAIASAQCYFAKVWINCIFCGDFCLAEQSTPQFTSWELSTLQQSSLCLSKQTMQSSWGCLEDSDNLSGF